MKNTLLILSITLLFDLAVASDLQVQSSNKSMVIASGDLQLPGTDVCYPGQKISAPRFSISKLATTWAGSGNFRPIMVKISVEQTENNSYFRCAFSSAKSIDSIALELGFSTDEVNKGPNASVTGEALCSLQCGDFPIIDKSKPVNAHGKIGLYGIETKIIGGQTVEVQVTSEAGFDVNYTP